MRSPDCDGGLEQLRGRVREMRAEHERRRRAVRRQRAQEQRRPCPRHTRGRPSAPLPAARLLEPVEQRPPHRADDAQLRKVHVRVDEARKDEPAAPVDRDGAWIRVANVRRIAACDDAAVVDQKPAVFMTISARRSPMSRLKRIRPGCERWLRGRAPLLRAPGGARWRTAKKTRSGVAGLSNVNGRPSPNAAMASRSASRTENASISGGSPTALLPITTPGCVGALEQIDVEHLGHLRPRRAACRSRRRRC